MANGAKRNDLAACPAIAGASPKLIFVSALEGENDSLTGSRLEALRT